MRFFRCVLIYDCVFHVILSGPSCVFYKSVLFRKRFIFQKRFLFNTLLAIRFRFHFRKRFMLIASYYQLYFDFEKYFSYNAWKNDCTYSKSELLIELFSIIHSHPLNRASVGPKISTHDLAHRRPKLSTKARLIFNFNWRLI